MKKIKYAYLNTAGTVLMIVAAGASFAAKEYTNSMILASLACINSTLKTKEDK